MDIRHGPKVGEDKDTETFKFLNIYLKIFRDFVTDELLRDYFT